MLWKFIVDGGWPMAPILACSVLALALLLERGWFWLVLRLNRDDGLRQGLLGLRFDAGRAAATRDPICQVLHRYAAKPGDPDAAVALAERIVRETRSTVPVIQVIAAVSTSLGLLGTVVGVALAFQRSAGNPSMAELVPALSIALNTTILGLLVYLPTFVGAQLSSMASSRLAFQMEQGLNALQSRLRTESADDGAVVV